MATDPSQQDGEGMLACVSRLYECEDLERFAEGVLAELPRLIGSEHTTFNYVAPSVPKVVSQAAPRLPDHARRQKLFSRHLVEHPVLQHYLATGDGSAHRISDFLSVREFHALPLYRNCYHDIGYEDQLSVVLFCPGFELVAISLARDRRNFTERDRRILNLLRPHLAKAYRHVEHVALLKRELQGTAEPVAHCARVTSVMLDREDRPVQFGAEARRWIDHFFPKGSRTGSHLPEAVTEWLRRTREVRPSRGMVCMPRAALEQERDGQLLRLRIVSDPAHDRRMLLLGMEILSTTAQSSVAGRLTQREVDVLLQVEQGRSNAETAAVLGISPLTVRCHLEHIFEKLNVPSRTAAVTRFRHLCSRIEPGAV